ncbi:alpha-terpineol synthase, chloroplastic-like isoform X1 [Macadamia integrifolia]|uniref:alpha-terpineol synthase, chloroplastic-like isoform X1 n=1 Tax=Macadamia integrifolia TaxID=60698 RepID=UPI001C4E8C17|nr:alpha-terpineol synthase, chloroplastic-like isoform X1 [Macadamia integrifolia]
MGGSLGHPRMALHLYILSTPSSSKGFIHCRPLSHQWMISSNIKCLASTHSTELTTYIRRSANYQSSIWDFDFVQSLNSDYKGEAFKRKTKKLKEEVRGTLDDGAMGQLDLLELIDDIERLGLGYLFEEEIKKALDTIVSMEDLAKTRTKESLHATALQFRLLRQHGYEVNQGMFNHLKDEIGNFKATYLADAKGILSLYEASHLAFEGETILEEAKNFTMTALKEIIKGNIEKNLAKQVNHALELPLHWRVPRLEARWYIDIYEKKENSIAALIELAKLDFNIVQVIHQENVADLSRWWEILGLGKELSFARDSLIQCFLWTLGWKPEPQFSNFRIELAKVTMLITTIDDLYDVYGSLEELELFTDAVERWDIKAIGQLPYYMKICFLALFNSVNEMGYFHLKEHGIDSIPFLKKAWIELCKAYLIEAKWYHNNDKTTLKEYLNNAVITIGNNVVFIHSFFSLQQTIREEELDCVSQYPSLFYWTSMIVRLANDLSTSMAELERGDVLKSIQSYMYQTGASKEVACEYIRNMIDETWKKINNDLYTNDFLLPQPFIETMVNHARMSLCMYQYGDGHGVIDDESIHRANLLLFEPIPLLRDA